MLRTMSPPPGIAQLWNFSVLRSKRTMLGAGLVLPERAFAEADAVRLRFRPARRSPLLVRAARKIEPVEIAAREIRIPHRVIGPEREAARARCRIRQDIFADRQGARIDGADLVG